MTWQVVPINRSLAEHAMAWDDLNDRLFESHPLLSSQFVDPLLRHFGTGDERLCIDRHDDGSPTAMCILRRRRPGVWSSFLPSQAQIAPTLMKDAASTPGLFRALPGFAFQIEFLCNDPMFGMLASRTSAATPSATDHALTIAVHAKDGFDAYWMGRSKQLRKNHRRWERLLFEHDIRQMYRVIESPAEMNDAVRRYGLLEAEGWKGKAGTAVGDGTSQHAFYCDVMNSFALGRGATAHELWLGGRLAASRLLIHGPQMTVILKTAYAEDLQRYAPGRLLLREAIRHCVEARPHTSLEFYTNASVDQRSWATDERLIQHVTFHRHRLVVSGIECVHHIKRLTTAPALPPSALSVDSHSALNQLPDDLKSLFDASERMSVELGTAWLANFASTVLQETPPLVYVVRENGQALLALPLVVDPSRWRHAKVEPASNYYTSVHAPATAEAVTASHFAFLFREIARRHRPVAAWRLEPLDASAPVFEKIVEGLRLAGMRVHAEVSFGNWFQRITEGWDAYFQARPGAVRSTVRRMGRRLQKDGATMEVIQSAADAERGLAAYERVYARSWKRSEPFPGFIPGLVKLCAERGWLRLGIVWLNGEPIAAQLWIVAHGKASIFKLAYDAAHKARSPGTVLTAHLMRHVIEQDRVTEVDYLTGDDPYKKLWMGERRERLRLLAYNPRTPLGMLYVLRDSLKRRSSQPTP